MASLPNFQEEDIQLLNKSLSDLLSTSEAKCALIIDKGGFLITRAGEDYAIDLTTLGALAAAAFSATEGVASLMSEENFSSIYHQGEKESMMVHTIDEHCLLVVIFSAKVSAGAVKYYAQQAIQFMADQIRRAKERDPAKGLDLSAMNLENTEEFFKRKQT